MTIKEIGQKPTPMPGWLLEIFPKPESSISPASGEPEPGRIPEGQRNTTLASMAGSMRRPGFGQGAITDALLRENRERCDPPLSDKEVEDIARSIGSYPAGSTPIDSTRMVDSGFNFTCLPDLLAEPPEEVEWCWDQTLPAGGLSILAAKPKVGKSTLARNLAFAVASGEEFLGRAINQGTVVYIALEEKRSEVQKHFSRMGASGDL